MGVAVLLALLVLWSAHTGFVVAASSSAGTGGLTPTERSAIMVDVSLYHATVPSYAYLGQNFTVKLEVSNTSNESLPLILELSAPVDMLYVSPLIFHQTIPAGSHQTFNFSVVAIQTASQGSFPVTAKIWIWFIDRMSTPELVSQTTTQIYGIGPSPVARIIVPVLLLTVAAVILVFVVIRRRAKVRAQ